MVFFKKYLPIASFLIGSAALTFQTTVLYPWHIDLDNEFQELKKLKIETDKEFKDFNEHKLERIHHLEEKIDYLIRNKKK